MYTQFFYVLLFHKGCSKRELSDHQVAFTAGISSTDLHNLGEHQTIIFDKVLTNFGNAYHPHTGIFFVPFSGGYVITVTVTVKPGLAQWLELVVDGRVINSISAGPAASNDYASTTKQWILQLNSGSEVLLRTEFRTRPDLHGNMNTMFSAFLLFEI